MSGHELLLRETELLMARMDRLDELLGDLNATAERIVGKLCAFLHPTVTPALCRGLADGAQRGGTEKSWVPAQGRDDDLGIA